MIQTEIERQCSIGAGECTHDTEYNILSVSADLDICALERIPADMFRSGVAAATQAIVDDIGSLVQRRRQASANPEITATILGIGRRIVAMPLPHTPDDAPMDHSSVLLDVSSVTDEQVLAAAAALRDADHDIVEAEIDGMPPDQQRTMAPILRQHLPPPWSEMDSIRRSTYIYRARRMIAAMVVS